MINSMQSVRTEDIGSIEFLKVIIPIVRESLKGRKNETTSGAKVQNLSFSNERTAQVLSAREVSMILYGLQGFRSEQTGNDDINIFQL